MRYCCLTVLCKRYPEPLSLLPGIFCGKEAGTLRGNHSRLFPPWVKERCNYINLTKSQSAVRRVRERRVNAIHGADSQRNLRLEGRDVDVVDGGSLEAMFLQCRAPLGQRL